MIDAAAGATVPKTWTCAMTSCRLRRSSCAASSICIVLSVKLAFICSIASSEMGSPWRSVRAVCRTEGATYELLLGLREPEPKLPPCPEARLSFVSLLAVISWAHVGREQRSHRWRRIAGGQRGLICRVRHLERSAAASTSLAGPFDERTAPEDHSAYHSGQSREFHTNACFPVVLPRDQASCSARPFAGPPTTVDASRTSTLTRGDDAFGGRKPANGCLRPRRTDWACPSSVSRSSTARHPQPTMRRHRARCSWCSAEGAATRRRACGTSCCSTRSTPSRAKSPSSTRSSCRKTRTRR